MGKKRAPNAVDRHVGLRIRIRLIQVGISQTELADALGLSFQQIQKYERGSNRISIGTLSQIATALRTTIPFFLLDAPKLPRISRLGNEP